MKPTEAIKGRKDPTWPRKDGGWEVDKYPSLPEESKEPIEIKRFKTNPYDFIYKDRLTYLSR